MRVGCSSRLSRAAVLALGLVTSRHVVAYDLDVNSNASLKQVASDMTQDMLSFYSGDQPGGTPGLLPNPYYWWEAGAMLGALIDYWYYTGDDTYNNLTEQGLLFQVGPNNDYMPPNQTLTEGNDDQGFWGMAVMSAAEYNFQNPPASQPQWLALAQAVFNTQAARWDTSGCGGGLRWQIFTWNNGYDYKNSISQACFFNLAARLALYTGNQTYADWAVTTWNWMEQTGLLANQSDGYHIFDGMHTENCSSITPYQWTYNAGAFLLGAAAMYNFTNGSDQDVWRERVDNLLNGTDVFFNKGVMVEIACETVGHCDVDELSFKAFLSRWMAATTKWAPWTYNTIKPLMASSAVAAAAQCKGGNNGRMCGLIWTDNGTWDGTSGVGQQMAAMEVVLANMISDSSAPVTNNSGGTSSGNSNGGGSDVGRTQPYTLPTITAADRAGAGICTVLLVCGLLSGVSFMLLDETSAKTPAERWGDLSSSVVGGAAGAGAGAAGAGAFLRRKVRRSPLDEKSKGPERFDSDETSETITAYPAAVAAAPPVDELSSYYQHRSTGSFGSSGYVEHPPSLPPIVAGVRGPASRPVRTAVLRKPLSVREKYG